MILGESPSRIFHFVQTFVVGPLKELWAALIRDRPNNLRLLLYLNFAVYFILITTYAYAGERYLYMSKASKGKLLKII